MTYVDDSVAATQRRAKRQEALRSVRAKRKFWRQMSWFSVINAGCWLSWTIEGVRGQWVTPWPLIVTVVWGSYMLFRVSRLGGFEALRHATIDREIQDLRRPDGPIHRDRLVRRPIVYGTSSGYRPTPHLHLSDVIDARESRLAEREQDADEHLVT